MAERRPAAAAATGALEQRVAELESMLTLVARFAAHLAVHSTKGQTSATFRQIAVQELRIASNADVDRLESWLREHGG
jgi:hypothetical protein